MVIMKKIILFIFMTVLTSHIFSIFTTHTFNSARSIGIGKISILFENDIASGIENPALLPTLKDFQVSSMGNNYMNSLSLFQFDISSGISYNNFGFAGNLSLFFNNNYYSETVGGLYFGYGVNNKYFFGIGIKYLSYSILEYDFWGINFSKQSNITFGINLSFAYKLSDKVLMTFIINNINSPKIFNNNDFKYNLTPRYIIGTKYQSKFISSYYELQFRQNEFLYPTLDIKIGFEKDFFNNFLAIRTGVATEDSLKGFYLTFGTGINLKYNIKIDYGLIYSIDRIESSLLNHFLSVKYNLKL